MAALLLSSCRARRRRAAGRASIGPRRCAWDYERYDERRARFAPSWSRLHGSRAAAASPPSPSSLSQSRRGCDLKGRRRRTLALLALAAGCVILLLLTLLWGSVSVPSREVVRILLGEESQPAWESIVLQLRLPRALAAALIGAALGLAGLEMQTVFRNPLAEPFILGVSAGASLGVAMVVLAGGGALDLFGVRGLLGALGMVGAAAVGAGVILALMLLVSSRVAEVSVVLVLGVVLAAIVGALVTLLVFFADPERTRAFVEWGFGSFARVTLEDLGILAPILGLGAGLAALSIKDLNALLLGEGYARTLGISIPAARLRILGSASLLSAATVAFAGPIGFLGIAVPHLARGLFATADHRVLLPATLLFGALFGLGCGLLAELPGSATLFPVNAATALLCGPVVFWVLLRLAREGGL